MAGSCNHYYRSGSTHCAKCGQERAESAWGKPNVAGGGNNKRRNNKRHNSRRGPIRRRNHGRRRSTPSRIPRFIIYGVISTIGLFVILYAGEWLVYEQLPLLNQDELEAAEENSADMDNDRQTAPPQESDRDSDFIGDLIPTPILYTTEEESRDNLAYINEIRAEHGSNTIKFDVRAYELAHARVLDMLEYHYHDHVNPHTGTCPYTMKSEYGFAGYENVAENLAWIEGFGHMGPNRAVGVWMDSVGHRHNLLYPEHTGGATVCDSGVCVFLGVNNGLFGQGCYTGAEGEAYWRGR